MAVYRGFISTVAKTLNGCAIGLIKLYQWTISPLLGNCCRFYPSCSMYAKEAIEQFGFVKGLRLAVWRLVKCHPFHSGGIDPVPKKKN